MRRAKTHNEKVNQSQIQVGRLLALQKEGQLSESAYQKLVGWAVGEPSREEWTKSVRFWCLLFGVALITSGVLFFGAFNWAELSRFQKFAIMEALLVAGFFGVLTRGLDSTAGKVCLVATSVLVGVLLAVYGQVYQTGADSYNLFLGWSLLILPWTLASRTTAQWLLQLVLVNVTFVLWWDQVLDMDFVWFSLLYLALNGTIALVWEKLGRDWMWKPGKELFLTNGLVPLTCASCLTPWEGDEFLLSLLVLAGVWVYLYKTSGQVLRTMTLVAASVVTVGGSFIIWIFHEADVIGLLFMALAMLAEMAVAVAWLRGIHQAAEVEPLEPVNDSPSDKRETPAEQLAGLAKVDVDEARLALAHGTELPWYVRALTGFGAWIASWFLIGFVLIGISGEMELVGAFGFALCAASVWVRRSAAGEALFLQYACLSANLAGQILAVVAVGDGFDGWVAACATALMIQLLSTWLYPDRVGRFLFTASAVVFGAILFGRLFDDAGWQLWLAVIALGLVALQGRPQKWLSSGARELFGPVTMGLAAGFFGLLQVSVFAGPTDMNTGPLLGLAFGVMAAGVALLFRAPIVAVVGLALLGAVTHSVPGIMAAVLVFLLSFHSRSRMGLNLSVAFLVSFGSFFYYSLELTLIAKSLTLLGSGVVVLLVRLFLAKEPELEVEHSAF